MAIARISEARLRLIKKRQWTQRWGEDYIAAQWATPQEAPSLSMPSILYPLKLGCRPFHTLSQQETWVALLLLYNPAVWDIHEQRVLYPELVPHPLQGHPRALGQTFPPLRGTLSVSERMGLLTKHPKCRVKLADGSVALAPFPYLGDLLTYIEDEAGSYVVNITVKDKQESFRQRLARPGKPVVRADNLGSINRHALEKIYYDGGGIPTRQVVGSEIDLELRVNLNELFMFHAEATSIPQPVKCELWQFFHSNVGTAKTADAQIRAVAENLRFDLEEVRAVLMQGIWFRKVLVDLFKPVLMDRPLRPMVDDPLQVYRDLFARGTRCT